MASGQTDDNVSRSVGAEPRGRWQTHLPRAVALILYGLLVDTAVETWWSGSPMRWWVVAAVAVDIAGTAMLWRRITWETKATTSSLVLLGLMAVTAWLPGGLSVGMRIAGAPTPTVLSLFCVAAVALAASVVWRFRVLPRSVRTAFGLLAAYGLIAFGYGATAGVPFSALLGGDSLWQRLPAMLQGAFIGGCIVLPLALLVAVVRAGIPRFRDGSPRFALYQIVALGTCVAIVLAALPYSSESRRIAAAGTSSVNLRSPEPATIVPSPALSDALENSLRAIEDGDRESPHDRWDPAYVVEQVGKNPRDLFDWVATQTFWVPYRGSLRGPVGVLMDRMGNSFDRAVLLATLLEQAGHAVRLAHGELAANDAGTLLPMLIVARRVAAIAEREASEVDSEGVGRVAVQYKLDGPSIGETIRTSSADGDRVLSLLRARGIDQTARLRAAIGRRAATNDLPARMDAAVESLRDHWWVQRQEGATWSDLDLLSRDMKPLAPALETLPLHGVSAAQLHQVVVRVIAEQWTQGKVAEHIALEHVLRPGELIGKSIVLGLWPMSWPSELVPQTGDSRRFIQTTAIRQHEWLPTLRIGEDTFTQSSIRDTGELNEHPAIDPFTRVGASVSHGADDVADMLGGIDREKTGTGPKSILTAAWLEYEIRVPGDRPRLVRREVFDILGSEARRSRPVVEVAIDDARILNRSLALMMQTEILPVACRLPAGFTTHLLAKSLLANRELLRGLVSGKFSESKARDVAEQLVPLPSPLYQLAFERLESSHVGYQVFMDRPDILTRHLSLAATNGTFKLRDATDIVANEVGVDLSVGDAFAVRLAQGVFDTNAESLVHGGAPATASTAEAFVAAGDWVALSSPSDAQLTHLSLADDVRRYISDDLAAGDIVVVRNAPVVLNSRPFVGWWRVDPRTGHALGVDRIGWGVASIEYAKTVAVAAGAGYVLGWLDCNANRPTVASNFANQDIIASRGSPPLNPFSLVDSLVTPLEALGSTGCLGPALLGALLGAILGFGAAVNPGGGRPPVFGNGGAGGPGASGGAGAGAGGGAGARGGTGGGAAAGGEAGAGGGGAAGEGGGASGRPGVDPLGKTGVDPLGKTQTDPMAKTQADPLGKTELDPTTTHVQENPPVRSGEANPAETAPRVGRPTNEEVIAARDAAKAAEDESFKAGADWINYHNRQRVGDPSWNPTVDEALLNESNNKSQEAIKAILRYRQLSPRGTYPSPAPKPSGNFPGCPPNCGNENKTLTAGNKSVAGAVSLNNILSGK